VGGTNTFDVTSNVNWTITSSETWLTISQLSGSNTINGLIATASANTGGTSRTAIITVFETGNPSLNGIINVTQAAFIQNSYLNVSPSTFQFDGCYIGNLYDAKVFSITSNVNWLVTCSEPWIEISSLTTGSNDRDIRFYPSIVNDSSTSRTATITVSDTNTVNPAAPQTITITQNASVINEFFLRLDNQTGSTVTCLSFYTSDLIHPSGTGNPFLTYAAIENTDGTIRTDIKTIDRGLIDFTVSNGEKCIFRIKWVCGVFPLGCRTILSPFYNICTSGGCKISGDYDIPSDFMARLFRDSPVYTHQAGDTYDMSGLRPQNIGSGFFRRTWDNCQSLINPIVPITDSWNPSTIENDFLYETWRGCNGLVYTISPNTTNWNNMKTIGNNFMYQTFHYGGEYITYAIAPNTLNWNITSIGSEFMTRTWMTLNRYNNIDVTIQGEIYVGDIQPLGTQCAGFHYDNNRINRVIVGSQPLVVRFQNSTYWSEISDSKFVAS
jgi:hypothetical protein